MSPDLEDLADAEAVCWRSSDRRQCADYAVLGAVWRVLAQLDGPTDASRPRGLSGQRNAPRIVGQVGGH